MAAEISFLLFALIDNIRAEEVIVIREVRGSHSFTVPEEADTSCLISRFVGEEKLVLWNTSALWSQNSTVPKDISSYVIRDLTHSDSGPYQEECWTEGSVTHEKNISLTVCTSVSETRVSAVREEETVDLTCEGAADSQDVHWLKPDFRYKQETWTRVFGDDTTSVMDSVGGRYQVLKNTSALRIYNLTMTDFILYMCLVMNQQRCVSGSPVRLQLKREYISGSVEETAVLPCTVRDVTDDRPPRWSNNLPKISRGHRNTSVDQNYSLVFSWLTLDHSGTYVCQTSIREQMYVLVVCPKSGPSAVEFFSEGEDVTVRCSTEGRRKLLYWFIKSERTEGRVVVMHHLGINRITKHPDGRLVISNVSLEDAGEYWCAVTDRSRRQCVSTSRTLLQSRQPFGIHSVIYAVRNALLSGLLVTLCVSVVTVNWRTRRTRRTRRIRRIRRTRRGEQPSAETQLKYSFPHRL